MTINFYEVPYNHAGTWERDIDSIMNPGTKVTWPNFIVECIIYWRIKLIKDYPKVTKGPGWSKIISGQVRRLAQQVHVLVNYFEHPSQEPLVVVAFKNYLRQNRVTTVGGYRKVRYKTINDRKVLNISKAEKDFINGVAAELNRLKKQRESFATSADQYLQGSSDNPTSRFGKTIKKRKSLADLEKELNG